MMRIVYFGSGEFGLPTLRALAGVLDVRLVVTGPDRPAGRGRRVRPNAIAGFAARQGLAAIKPERPADREAIDAVRAAEPDALVVIAYGHKLGPALIGDVFALNLHASLLPKYRGAAPINWAMIRGERRTGLSVITLAQEMDGGLILGQRAVAIDPMETAGELHDRLAGLGPELVLETLAAHREGTLEGSPQDPAAVTRAPKLSRADATVSFDQPAGAVRCRVHGLTPWPGCRIELAGHPLRLHRVEEVGEAREPVPPGTWLGDDLMACGPGAVRLLAVQPPGRPVMSFEAWRHGHELERGARCVPA